MFLVTHFSDVRIVNSDIRDIILQSISVLVQYKEHVVAFERSQAAREGMVGSLLASFDNRFWIPVSNILLRLCKGSGFGASKCSSHGESFSPHFQVCATPRTFLLLVVTYEKEMFLPSTHSFCFIDCQNESDNLYGFEVLGLTWDCATLCAAVAEREMHC
jgi:hypothetical protein